ncbi:uncharacterized protein LOC133300335, partial [Gastrolobium bilobum]|uniref:uncharacterized protein LOC133300335 n=1 Tax=Gastrolobium bilobum TaxID=150636 RepID=UPI002AB32706
MKDKKLNVKNPFDLFKKPGTQKNFVDRGSPPKCKGCGKEHRGPCVTGEVICYKCGKFGHYSRQCPQYEVKTMTVQATVVPVSTVPPMIECQTVGRVYTMDRQQSEKAPNLIKGTIYIDNMDIEVLFDSRATHFCMSDFMAVGLNLQMYDISPPMKVVTATGEECYTSVLCKDVEFKYEGRGYVLDFICLPM